MVNLRFVASSLYDLHNFPEVARKRAGFALMSLLAGDVSPDWQPIPQVGEHSREIRIHVDQDFWIIHVAYIQHQIYVLHAFERGHAKTAERHLFVTQQRHQQVMQPSAPTAIDPDEQRLSRVMGSSGEIFHDMGFGDAHAAKLNLQAKLLLQLRQYLNKEGLEQEQAAGLLGVHPAVIGNITRGKIDKFTLDSLIEIIASIGGQVDISVTMSEHHAPVYTI